MSIQHLFILLASSVCISACGANSPSDPREERLKITPITLYVGSMSIGRSQPHHQSFAHFLQSHYDGTPRYDAQFRAVAGLSGPIAVDCQDVSALAIYLHVDATGYSTTLFESLRIRYTWTHSEIELQGNRYDFVRGKVQDFYLPGSKHIRGKLPDKASYSEGHLKISNDHERTDGIYTVVVSHLGHEVYRAQFLFEDCEVGPRA